jgi:hypothetical protein
MTRIYGVDVSRIFVPATDRQRLNAALLFATTLQFLLTIFKRTAR